MEFPQVLTARHGLHALPPAEAGALSEAEELSAVLRPASPAHEGLLQAWELPASPVLRDGSAVLFPTDVQLFLPVLPDGSDRAARVFPEPALPDVQLFLLQDGSGLQFPDGSAGNGPDSGGVPLWGL